MMQTKKNDFWKIFKFILKYDSKLIVIVIFLALLNAILPYSVILVNTYLLNQLIVKNIEFAKHVAIEGYIFILFLSFLNVSCRFYFDIVAKRVDEKVKNGLHESWEKVDYQTLVSRKYYSDMNKSESSFRYIGGITTFYLRLQQFIQGLLAIIFGLGLIIQMIMINFDSLTMAVFGVMIIFQMIFWYIYHLLTIKNLKLFSLLLGLEKVMNYFLLQVVNKYENIKSIKIGQMIPLIQKRYKDVWKKERKSNIELINLEYTSQILSVLVIAISVILLLIILIHDMYLRKLEIGSLNTLFGSVVQIATAISTLIVSQQSLLRFGNQFSFVKNNIELSDDSLDTQVHDISLNSKNLEVRFDHVSFSYDEKQMVLDDLNFSFTFDKTIALIGVNGSGKSTLIKLLLRLYQPSKGKITINNIDINDIPMEQYKELFSVAFQDFTIFDFSIGENITASSSPDKAKLQKIIKKWKLDNWINKLQNGVATSIGNYQELNFQPSGGQKQQLAIARADYFNRPFQILDEPTASLDPLKELKIFTEITKLAETRPTMFITHRMGATKLVDNIILLKNGKYIGQGSQKELLSNNTYFQKLWNEQKGMYKLDV